MNKYSELNDFKNKLIEFDKNFDPMFDGYELVNFIIDNPLAIELYSDDYGTWLDDIDGFNDAMDFIQCANPEDEDLDEEIERELECSMVKTGQLAAFATNAGAMRDALWEGLFKRALEDLDDFDDLCDIIDFDLYFSKKKPGNFLIKELWKRTDYLEYHLKEIRKKFEEDDEVFYKYDSKSQSIEILTYLRMQYADVPYNLTSVTVNVVEDGVFVKVVRKIETKYGTLEKTSCDDLSVCVEDVVNGEDVLAFPPTKPILQIVEELVSNKCTMDNITSIFDKE